MVTEHEIDVEWVPICAHCGEPVQRDADDAGWQHDPALGEGASQCRHEAWELDGNRRTCADCGARLPDDPAREPRRINPTFIT